MTPDDRQALLCALLGQEYCMLCGCQDYYSITDFKPLGKLKLKEEWK